MSVLLALSTLGAWLIVMVLLLPLMVGVWSDLLPAQADRIIASAKTENAVFMMHQTKKAPNQ